MVDEAAMNELRAIVPGAQEMIEAGITYIHLPRTEAALRARHRGSIALHTAAQHSGYTTRLFLSQQVNGKGANWTTHQIFGKTWQTWSWNNVPSNIRPAQILRGHLEAFK
jgi:hypothetical protein